ncbi:regulator of sirC expression with transglutaminase-like and TPR domain [Elusimicrobium posterum]|uniref:transglutaminase family protein n=1 Tax=Elusimicrobium posterum TaxID=3116653 RepID=UPI003C794382
MQQNQIRALIKLITAEEDGGATELKRELTHVIKNQPAALKDVLKEDFNGTVPAFVNSLVEEVAWERLKKSFTNFAGKINPDLEEGLILLSQFEHIAPLKESFNLKLDTFVKQTRRYIINCADTLEVAEVLQKLFFDHWKLKVITNTLQKKHLSFDSFMQTREGTGLCIACLYYFMGLRYGLEINIVDVAGRMLVKFEDPAFNAPFYADPFDNGKLLTQKDCLEFVFARGMDWSDEYEKPLTSRMIIKRFLANMIYIHNKLKDERRLEFLRDYFSLFEQY